MGEKFNRLAKEGSVRPEDLEVSEPTKGETNRLASQQERPLESSEETGAAQRELTAVQEQIATLEGLGDRANVGTLERLRNQEKRLNESLKQEKETGAEE